MNPRPVLPLLSASLLLVFALWMSGCKADQATHHTEDQNSAVNYQAATARAHSQPMSQNEEQTVDDGRPVIACFGDSLTAGYGVDAADSYPSRLQALLDHDGYRYRVVNFGISGETTKDGLARVDRVLALHPAITIVEFGGNDGLRGVPIASSRANLDSIVDRLRKGGTEVALAGITLPPQFGKAYIQQFDQTYHVIADKYSVPLYPFLLEHVWGVSGSIQQDGVHPTAQGCRQVANNMLGFIRPMLKK